MGKWNEEEILDMVRAIQGSESVADAAQKIGVSRHSLKRALTGAGFGPPSSYLDSNEQEIPPPASLPSLHDTDRPRAPDHVRALVDFCKHKERSLEELCDHLDMAPGHVRGLVDGAREEGYIIDLAGDRLAWQRPEDLSSDAVDVAVEQPYGKKVQLGILSDLHYGSKYCRADFITDFVHRAYDLGVRLFLIPGDMLDGCYKHGQWELRAHGWDEQAQEMLEKLPRLDVIYYAIDGNHDYTFTDKTGMLSGRRLMEFFQANGRRDLNYLGPRRGILNLNMDDRRPVKVELWHPKKGKGYALSYQLQNHIRDYAVGEKPDILIAGHWHTFCYLEQRGVHAVAAPCFQGGGSAFGKSLSGSPSIGGLIMSYELTQHGTLRNVTLERSAYYEKEEARQVLV